MKWIGITLKWQKKKILLVGGAGFIGFNYINLYHKKYELHVIDNYDKLIHERVLQLGGTDFVWNEQENCSDICMTDEKTDEYFCIISDVE